MKKALSVLWILFSIVSNAQNFNPKILTLPENSKIEDFSFLKEELKNVQVVMLGEISHFDGKIFEEKTKIIKYLHEQMGFNTIAFESGVYDVWKAQKDINKGYETKKAFIKSLYTIWAKKNEFQSFIEFYDKNKTDLKLYGFDSQISGEYGEKELVNDLYEYCKKNHFKLQLKREDLLLLLESISVSSIFDEEDISYNQYKSSLTGLLHTISSKPQNEEDFYWSQIIKNLLSQGESYYFQKEPIISSFYASMEYNIRDKQMANNLLEYIKMHPNEKIICWGANVHFVNDMSSIATPVIKDFVPMGSYIKKELKDKVYSLATVTAADSIYLNNTWEKTPVNTSSFEYYLKKSDAPHLFISSNQPEMRKIQLNRLFSPITFIESRLDLLHDGYLYLNKSELATLIPFDENNDVKKSSPIVNKQEVISSNKQISSYNLDNSTIAMTIDLNEIIVYNKRTPYQIVKKAIESLSKNYPNTSVSSTMYTNLTTDIQNTSCLNLDFTANQYENGYFSMYRSAKQLKEIRWNTKNGYEPQNVREFYGLINNPIRSGAFLNSRKFSKLNFTLEEIKKHYNKEVYVISFSSPRNHSAFTGRVYLSDFTGTLLINKDDYAIVKIIENWEVTEFPEEHQQGLNLNGVYEKYTKKYYTAERIETDFMKIDKLYFISHSLIDITGKITDIENKSLPFKTTLDSYWSNFNIVNPVKIPFKDEQELFEKTKYNLPFWESFSIPK
jgi:hypothetical protein